ncbi:peptidase S41 [Phyllobacterium sp. 628]|uniref:peptidase S41 n=1 Tax=Phyllobacterium sp. 628 TaxID=2718938 RepID=UPI001FCEAED1|nr:peptidase S41 [Phyllobacterium sp. 628]
MLAHPATWRRFIPLLAMLLLIAVPASAQMAANQPPALTPAQMREDLTYLKTQWAPLDKSFSKEEHQAFDRVVDDAMAASGTLSTEEFTLEVMRAVAISRNGHTTAMVGTLLRDLPVRAWWFSDGLYIIKTDPQFANLLGARIDKLGALTPKEALRRVAPFISGTDQRIRYLSATFLTSPDVLKRTGAVADSSSIPLTLQLRDGSSQVAELKPATTRDPGDEHKPATRGYSVLIPDDNGLPGRWPHVLDKAEERSPIYSKRIDVTTSMIGQDKQVLYIRANSMTSLDETSLHWKYAKILNTSIVPPSRPKFVIFDLRLNNGGDFFNTILFSQALPKLLPPGGHIFVLVSRSTFSAAIVTTAMLKANGQDKVTLIGETMGDNGQFWAEGDALQMPNSHIGLEYATQFEDYEKGCTNPDKCYWATVAFGPRNLTSLAPDIKVDVAFSDYAAGRDPVLEKALSLAK